jgi:septum formation protein
MDLILASSSASRRELLNRLTKNYTAVSPDIDETQHDNESTKKLVARLAMEKAKAAAHKFHKKGLYIGSDQVAICDEQVLGKPMTQENAVKQLTLCSNKKVTFLTSMCLFNSETLSMQHHIDETHVQFRTLSPAEIVNYIEREQPLHCAGSFKSEGLGIHLFDSIQNNDPSALIGLPLIKLCEFLRNENYTFL